MISEGCLRLGTRVVLLVILSLCAISHSQMRAQNTASVQIHGSTSLGEPLDRFSVEMRGLLGTGNVYRAVGYRVANLEVPTGWYLLKVSSTGFETHIETIRIYRPRVFHTVALAVARPEGADYATLVGKVVNYGGDLAKIRVRLMALYGSEVLESRIDAEGVFRFPGLSLRSAFLLVTVKDSPGGITIMDSLPLRIDRDETIEIDLIGKRGMGLLRGQNAP